MDAWLGVLLAAKFLLHLLLWDRYGIHRDELYFLQCAAHPDLGYVDHPPLIALWAGLATLFPTPLFGMRLLSATAGTLGLYVMLRLSVALGASRSAQWLAAASFLIAPAFLRMASTLNIVVFEPILWTAASLLLIRAIRRPTPTAWALLGTVIAAGLWNKHTMLLWGLGTGVGLIATPLRRHLRSPGPWLCVAVAAALWAPHLYWQVTHDWAGLRFLQNMQSSLHGGPQRLQFLAGQILYFHPLNVPLWVLGAIWLLRAKDPVLRLLGWQFATVLLTLLVTGGKPYYAGAAYPVAFAAGAITCAQRMSTWSTAARSGLAVLALLSGAGLGLLALPALPLPTVDAALSRMFGRLLPARELTHDLHDEYGWSELPQAARAALSALPKQERARAAIFTRNYGEAAAIDVLGSHDLPNARSGHMNYWFWGPGAPGERPTLLVGFEEAAVQHLCPGTPVRRVPTDPLAIESRVPMALCPRLDLHRHWPMLRHDKHGRPRWVQDLSR